ncbi:MAG: hypothetical protein ACK4UJ_09010 [Leptonema sp. (in: bacteria)]
MNEKRAFFIGVGTHLIFIFTRIRLFSLECIQDCSSIVIADIPISILYLAFSDSILIIFSAIIGSLLWGFYYWLIYMLLQKIF